MTEMLDSLHAAMADLVKWLKDCKTKSVIVGGVAASLLGRPRLTRDVDALVSVDMDRLPLFLESGKQFGFCPRKDKCVEFAQKNRVLLLVHAPSKIEVDMMLAGLPYEEELIARATQVSISNFKVSLPIPEDLIIMKSLAMRPRDIGDIEGLLDAHPKLNLKHIRFWVREFAAALENPDMLIQLENLLKHASSKGRPKNKKSKR